MRQGTHRREQQTTNQTMSVLKIFTPASEWLQEALRAAEGLDGLKFAIQKFAKDVVTSGEDANNPPALSPADKETGSQRLISTPPITHREWKHET
jgi:hypothetical protein